MPSKDKNKSMSNSRNLYQMRRKKILAGLISQLIEQVVTKDQDLKLSTATVEIWSHSSDGKAVCQGVGGRNQERIRTGLRRLVSDCVREDGVLSRDIVIKRLSDDFKAA